MRIRFGNAITLKGEPTPIVWDSAHVLNGHITVVGSSGTGKTFRLRRLMAGMRQANPAIRFTVLDPHGDMLVDGEHCIRFSESAEWGLNPLRISDDPDHGGVRKRTRAFIGMLNRTSRPLGSKQEAVLVNLLTDLYAAFGFLTSEPQTWLLDHDPRSAPAEPKRYPTIADLKRFAEYRLTAMLTGAGSTAHTALEKLNLKLRALDRAGKKAMGGDEEIDLRRFKADVKVLFADFVDSLETGRELDEAIKYYSRDVLQSVYERIVNLESTGLFKDRAPEFDEAAGVHRYDIAPLSADEQKMFVETVAADCFDRARQRGHHAEPIEFLVIDEAHKFVCGDSDQILNVIAREARKFGLGLILSSQNLGDFPEDCLSNCATKIILGLDEMFHEQTARKLRVAPIRLAEIRPHKSALVQIKTKTGQGNHFVDVRLG